MPHPRSHNDKVGSLSGTSQPRTSANRPDNGPTLVAAKDYAVVSLPMWDGSGCERKR